MRAPLAFVAAALLLSVSVALPAHAACKRFGFIVNDYGKDGPTKDAKELLDKNILEWSAKSGIKDYSVGPKSVSCYQFLNFIVFDEHTCTASANVCWGPDKKSTDGQASTGTPPTPVRKTAAADATKKGHKHKGAAPAAEAAPAAQDDAAAAMMPTPDATSAAAAPDAAGALPAADNAATESAPSPSDAAAPMETGSTAPPSVETGALGAAGVPQAPEVSAAPKSSAATNKAKAAEAAAAAAAAAERAAAAAETAANAAKEAAAAAVAASAAGRGSFVPPLGEAMEAQKAKSAHPLGDAR